MGPRGGERGGASSRAAKSLPVSDIALELVDSLKVLDPDDRLEKPTSVGWTYVSFAFQKIGAPNLRMSRTFFRKAVGWTHSPHGTYGTSVKASFWISSASCLRLVSSLVRTQSLTSLSSCGISGQPNQAFGPAPDMPKWTAGLMTSAACHHV